MPKKCKFKIYNKETQDYEDASFEDVFNGSNDGLVPQPVTQDETKFLNAQGQWAIPNVNDVGLKGGIIYWGGRKIRTERNDTTIDVLTIQNGRLCIRVTNFSFTNDDMDETNTNVVGIIFHQSAAMDLCRFTFEAFGPTHVQLSNEKLVEAGIEYDQVYWLVIKDPSDPNILTYYGEDV